MSTDPTDWHQVLAHVTGALVRGEQRVSTQKLFAKLGLLPLSVRRCSRHILEARARQLFRRARRGLSISGVGSRSPRAALHHMQVARTCARTPRTPGAALGELSQKTEVAHFVDPHDTKRDPDSGGGYAETSGLQQVRRLT
jgi:hypothetical protein